MIFFYIDHSLKECALLSLNFSKLLSKPIHKGVFWMGWAMLCFSIGNAIVKAAAAYSISQIIFVRSLATLASIVITCGLSRDRFKILRTRHPIEQTVQGILGAVQLFFIFLSFQLLPFSDATTISFSNVLFVAALSPLILKSKVLPHQWTAILIGFFSILLIVRPTGNVAFLALAIALTSTVTDAVILMLQKILGRKDHAVACVFYHTLGCLFFSGIGSFYTWIPITGKDILILSLIGITGFWGQVAIVHAYRESSPVILGPVIYTMMIWGVIFGYLLWDEVPSLYFWMGTPILIGSGWYLIRKE